MPVSRDERLRCLRRHRIASARLREAPLRRPASPSVEAARAEDDGGGRVWESSRQPRDLGGLDRRASADRVTLRRRPGDQR